MSTPLSPALTYTYPLNKVVVDFTATAKSLQSCPVCATPSLGFSRQEHWSGLPLPSPMHKSEK